MLPDFPDAKKVVGEKYREFVNHSTRKQLGVFDEAAKTVIHEGHPIIHRADGESRELDMPVLESKSYIKGKHISEITAEQMFKVLDEIGEGLAQQQANMILTTMAKEVENVVNAAGLDSIELIFSMFDKVHVDFDDQGRMVMPSIIGGSEEAVQKMRDAMQTIEETDELRDRFEALIETKRQQWHDREASRELVE